MKLRLSQRKKLKQLPSVSAKGANKPRKFERVLNKTEQKINARLGEVKDSLTVVVSDKSVKSPDVNSAGNKRGLHNRENPPDGEKMKKIRAMRNFYSKAMPKPQCNSCAFSTNCPQFRADYECAFLPMLNSHKIESLEDIMEYMQSLLGSNLQRLHLATIFERLGGGMPSTELSESFAMLMQQLVQLADLKRETPAAVAMQGKDSIIKSLFGSINILVNTTGQHKKEIADCLTAIPTEEGQDVAQKQMALTTGSSGRSVNNELLADFEASKLSADVSKKPAAKQSTIKVDTL